MNLFNTVSAIVGLAITYGAVLGITIYGSLLITESLWGDVIVNDGVYWFAASFGAVIGVLVNLAIYEGIVENR